MLTFIRQSARHLSYVPTHCHLPLLSEIAGSAFVNQVLSQATVFEGMTEFGQTDDSRATHCERSSARRLLCRSAGESSFPLAVLDWSVVLLLLCRSWLSI